MDRGRVGLRIGLAFAYLATLGGVQLAIATPAAAVVYCKTVGVPKGCVVRAPAVRVVYCTAPGIPVGCRVRPAVGVVGVPGIGRIGTPMNRGGPVNRVGRR